MALPITVTVGPLATATATGVSLSQKAPASQYLVINGTKAGSTFSANSICLSQSPAGAGAMTLNGALANTNPIAGAGGTAAAGAAVAYLSTPSRIYITGGSNESGRTFTIVGTQQSPNTFGTGIVVTETVTGPNASVASSANLYSTIISITVDAATAGAITVGHSGTATLDVQRRIIITSGGNDSGITFALVGLDGQGCPISETITGANASAAQSALSYLTVISIKPSAAVATTVTVGTNTVADSQSVFFDYLASNAQVAMQCTVSGTVNGTVQQTLEDPTTITNQLPTPTYRWTQASVAWLNHPDPALVGFITTVQGGYAYTPRSARVTLNSGTGSITSTFMQSYLQ